MLLFNKYIYIVRIKNIYFFINLKKIKKNKIINGRKIKTKFIRKKRCNIR